MTISSTMSARSTRTGTRPAPSGGYSYCTSSTCANGNILVNHNTELITRTSKWFAVVGAVKGPIPNWTYTNNIVSINPGIAITNGGSTGCTDNKTGNAAKIAACFSPYSMTHNALIGGTGIWPARKLSSGKRDNSEIHQLQQREWRKLQVAQYQPVPQCRYRRKRFRRRYQRR